MYLGLNKFVSREDVSRTLCVCTYGRGSGESLLFSGDFVSSAIVTLTIYNTGSRNEAEVASLKCAREKKKRKKEGKKETLSHRKLLVGHIQVPYGTRHD